MHNLSCVEKCARAFVVLGLSYGMCGKSTAGRAERWTLVVLVSWAKLLVLLCSTVYPAWQPRDCQLWRMS